MSKVIKLILALTNKFLTGFFLDSKVESFDGLVDEQVVFEGWVKKEVLFLPSYMSSRVSVLMSLMNPVLFLKKYLTIIFRR